MVEWIKLGDVCSVHTGGQLNRDNMIEDGLYPVVNGGREFSGYTNSSNEKANSITISQGGDYKGCKGIESRYKDIPNDNRP